MDASQYKDYVLVLLFVKYVSDKYAGNPHALIDVPAGGSFADMVALKNDKEIGDKINKLVARLADANESLKGAINVADFNDEEKLGKGKEMVDRLTKLVGIFEGLDFGRNRAEGDDLLGDAYEYLMRHFATESGKSKGQFYTPAEVSRVMAQVIELGRATSGKQSIFDPTCGSGSLLLKAHDEAKSRTGLDLALYGQEMDNATAALSRMNMVLHDCPTAEIWRDNTLANPHFLDPKNKSALQTFDYVVANPPFSTKAWSNGFDPLNDQFGRFEFGVPPAKNGDFAFLLHILKTLKSTGKGAVILPHGVLFRGGAEGSIRKAIVRQGYIKGIIGLPANLFYGTGIPACIVVIDKENAHARTGIFMIDASKGFVKDGNKNRLRAQDLHKIVDAFTKQIEIAKYSRMVPLAEIEKHGFNLNIPRYIDSSEPEDLQDIEAHLKGGIPVRDVDALADFWTVLPAVRATLFGPGDRPGYLTPLVDAAMVKGTILNHPEFAAFSARVTAVFDAWSAAHEGGLRGIAIGDHPKHLIATIAEDLLDRFKPVPLIDGYDVYQHLMTYWAEVMQDDTYILVQDGWTAGCVIRELVRTADGKFSESPDITLGRRKLKAELIPPALIVARFYTAEQAALEALQARAEEAARAVEELDEEHGGEDGLLAEAKTDKSKLTAKLVKDRARDIRADKDAGEERALLKTCAALIDGAAGADAAVKAAQAGLDTAVVARYAGLSEDQVKALLVQDKWLARMQADVAAEVDRVSQALAGRVKLLAERYAVPLPQLTQGLAALDARVAAHLARMGFAP